MQILKSQHNLNYHIMQGPELPNALMFHAIINIENEKTMIIGGRTGFYTTGQTHVYNHIHFEWSIGPTLIKERDGHAAGILTDEATYAKLAIVTGGHEGGYDSNNLKSTEILILDTCTLCQINEESMGNSWSLNFDFDKTKIM